MCFKKMPNEISLLIFIATNLGVYGITSSFCLVPKYHYHQFWNGTYLITPGTYVASGTTVQISCGTLYLDGPKESVCQNNGSWYPETANCLNKCPTLNFANSEIVCEFNSTEIDCSHPPDSTKATIKCKPGNEFVLVCKNSTWEGTAPNCERIFCGKKKNSDVDPWRVLITLLNVFCEGVLIHPRIVLTTSRCMTDPIFEQVPPKIHFTVFSCGKCSDSDIRSSRSVKEILIRKNFALVITEVPFEVSVDVQPICVSSDKFLVGTTTCERFKYHQRGGSAESKGYYQAFTGRGLAYQNSTDGRYYLGGIVGDIYNNSKGCFYNNIIIDIPEYLHFFENATKGLRVSKRCKLPEFPLHGNWYVMGDGQKKYRPGTITESPERVYLSAYCLPGYWFIGESTIYCEDGEWNYELGICIENCPSISSTKRMNVTCRSGNRNINCTLLQDSAIATFTCLSEDDFNIPERKSVICNEGEWQDDPPDCEMVCGIKSKGSFPWKVSVFDENAKIICKGTLISRNLVLTARHCTTQPFLFEDRIFSNLIVGVGQNCEEYPTSRKNDNDTQYSKISTVLHVPGYMGFVEYYERDLAVLVLETPFTFTEFVQPICVPQEYDERYFIEGGTIRSFEECREATPILYQRYFTSDRICVDANQSLDCHGGGLYLQNKINGRFYIHGVMSFSLNRGLALYTNITHPHLKRFLKSSRKNANICQLPPHPDHGGWSIHTPSPSESLAFEDHVYGETILSITCDDNYFRDGDKFASCKAGKWIPRLASCLAKCSSLFNTSETEVKCRFKSKVLKDCKTPPSGTIATFSCRDHHDDFNLFKTHRIPCEEGKWQSPPPNCQLICGSKEADADALIVGGNMVKLKNYPWQIALYSVKSKVLLCGGSLISPKMAISAAHCVTRLPDGKLKPIEDYEIVAGKFYRDYYKDPEAQRSKLKKIIVPNLYRSISQNFVADIAIFVTEFAFELSPKIQPVCLTYSPSLDNFVDFGWVAGWGSIDEGTIYSEELKELRAPLLDTKTCKEASPVLFTKYMLYDKICAGYIGQNQSVCLGDSGGGLVFKNKANGRYYLKGIVSVSPKTEGGCSSRHFALYTNVTTYLQFIDEARDKL